MKGKKKESVNQAVKSDRYPIGGIPENRKRKPREVQKTDVGEEM